MVRNTAIFIIILAIIAALVVGIQIGRKVTTGSLLASSPSLLAQQYASPSIIASPSATLQTFIHKECGVQFQYDSTYQVTESSNSAILINGATGDRISLACAAEIPIPPLTQDKIEAATVAGQPATLYHDASAQTGAPVDVVIFKHPTNSLMIALLGFGEKFRQFVDSLFITQ